MCSGSKNGPRYYGQQTRYELAYWRRAAEHGQEQESAPTFSKPVGWIPGPGMRWTMHEDFQYHQAHMCERMPDWKPDIFDDLDQFS